ncbi:MAG: Hpt domain-containing protein [Planctomycetota bacterium]
MASESPPIPSTEFAQATLLVDWSLALDIVGGDAGLLAEVLEAFLVEAPRQGQAIELAVKADDASALHLAAHTLKSSLRYLGAKDSQELASRLEQAGRTGAIAKMEVEPLAAEMKRRMELILLEAGTEWRRLRGGSR